MDDANETLMIEEQMKDVFSTMNSLRKSKELCDIVLCVGNRQIFAHRIVLASFSPYFYAMFTADLAESRQSSVTLKAIDAASVELLVEFAYTAQIEISDANVQNLLPVSAILQVSAVQKACCRFLDSQLDPGNCIGIMNYAEAYDCMDLAARAKDYCFRHFVDVSHQEEFLNLRKEQVAYFIGRDELFVQSEDEVLAALLRWLRKDLKPRMQHMQQLMSSVRIPFVSQKGLDAFVVTAENLNKTSEYKDQLSSVLMDVRRPQGNLAARKRCPPGPTVIFSAGGYLRESLSALECFDPITQSWTSLTPLPVPRSGAGAAYVGNMLYVIGGRSNTASGNIDTDAVDRYNPLTNKWLATSSLTVPRNRVGVAVHDDTIYAIGGGNGTVYYKSAERFSPKEQLWKLVAPMSCARIGMLGTCYNPVFSLSGVAVAVLNGRIYACGGFNGDSRLRSVEVYDPVANTWQLVAPMLVARSGAAVAALNDCLYTVGGYNGETQQNSVERYDPRTDTWTFVGGMRHRRSALGVAIFEGKIFALGGYDGDGFHGSVEVYHPDDDRWELLTSLSAGRSGAGVAVGWKPYL